MSGQPPAHTFGVASVDVRRFLLGLLGFLDERNGLRVLPLRPSDPAEGEVELSQQVGRDVFVLGQRQGLFGHRSGGIDLFIGELGFSQVDESRNGHGILGSPISRAVRRLDRASSTCPARHADLPTAA